MRKAPNICTDTEADYAACIASNWDTVQEAFNVKIPQVLADRLEAGKNKALETHEGQGTAFKFAGQIFQIWSGGSKGGTKWVIENDDVQIRFASPNRDWPIVVRYKASGLWEYGFQPIKDRIVKMLEEECEPIVGEGQNVDDWCRLSRADFCFDFYSPEFTAEMATKRVHEKILAPSAVKIGTVSTSTHGETITIGLNRGGGLQIQIYDKGQEITDISGKTWMFKVWEREGYCPPEDLKAKHVWRVEFRFMKDFLKDRDLRSFYKLQEKLCEVLAEAIMTRRLVVSSNDNHRERWPLHPLWAELYNEAGSAREYVPIGRQITLREEEYKEMLKKQSNGIVRAINVLEWGHFNSRKAQKMAWDWSEQIEEDENHEKKVQKNVEKFRYFREAQ